MALTNYSPCPCGSGKKFKWCCQPFYDRIEKAFALHANGQHDSALRTLEQLTREYPDSAEVWGRWAELLWENNRKEEAEQALARALEVNPRYAFGCYVQGMMRHEEREIPGALLLYRKAAELCDPEARELLADIYGSIGQCELILNRPLAARAAWEIGLRLAPHSENFREHLDQYFGEQSPFPPLARQAYSFRSPPADAPAERRQAWQQALSANQTGKLTDAARAFEQLTAGDPQDAAAWYNLGLVRAWLGDNAGALDALDTCTGLEPDESQAAGTSALGEVLRFGHGLEDRCDYLEKRVIYQIVDPETVGQRLSQERRLVDVQQGQGGIGGSLLEREIPPPRDDLALFETPRVAAFLIIVGDRLLLIHADGEMLAKARQIIEPLLGPALGPPQLDERTPAFTQIMHYALDIRFPQGLSNEHAQRLITQQLQRYFEEVWARRPLRSLSGVMPIDAAQHAGLRKKLLFLEDLANAFLPFPYDFDRLRHKLGLPTAQPMSAATDITAMNVSELAGLDRAALSDADLLTAFQTAQRLDADEIAGQFAGTLVARPPDVGRPDRWPLYSHLIQLALDRGDHTEALALVDAGERYDCEHNEGRRRTDYELRRAQVLLRSGDAAGAFDVYTRLVQRTPADLELLGKAAEAMLSARRMQDAARFADQGLARARQKGDRDRAGYFEELLAAAQKG
jgi:tetratricopeptide (TPR) repeat protein